MWHDALRVIIYLFYLLFGTLLLPLFGTVVSSAPTSRVSLVLALVVSFGTLALKSIDIAKVALVLVQSSHSATPRSYFERTRATLSRSASAQRFERFKRLGTDLSIIYLPP